MTFLKLSKVVAFVLRPILAVMTDKIVEELKTLVVRMYTKASATENPLDDLLVGFLLDVMDVERPDV